MGADVAARSPAARNAVRSRSRHARIRFARAAQPRSRRETARDAATASPRSSRPTSHSTPRSADRCGRSSARGTRSASFAASWSPDRSGVRRRAAHRRRTRPSDAGAPPNSRRRECRRFSAWKRSACANVAERIREETGGRVQLANFNSPTQIVISGDLTARCRPPAKRCSPPAQNGSCRSTFRARGIVNSWSRPSRVSPAPSSARTSRCRDRRRFERRRRALPRRCHIQRNLVRSIVDEVRWHDAAERLLSYDLDCVVEFGASGVLGPLMKRMPDAPQVMVVSDYAGVERLRAPSAALASARPARPPTAALSRLRSG